LDTGETVFVLAETRESGELSDLSRELVGLGLQTASSLSCLCSAVIIGSRLAGATEGLLSLGVSNVYSADDPSLAGYNPEVYLAVLTGFLGSGPSGIFLAGNTHVALDLMPRLAFALEAGLITDCVGLKVEEQGPVFSHLALSAPRSRSPSSGPG
jgi:electron transfer flavoprotein alpha subunit